MTDLAALIDEVKNARNLSTDAAFAKLVGVTPASVSNWKHGRNYPDAVQCARISELTGEPLQRVLGIVGEARAISAAEKQVWRRLATAATFAVAFLPWPGPTANEGLKAGVVAAYSVVGMHIM